MGTLNTQITKTLPVDMHLPEPLVLLFDWIEANGYFVDRPDGQRIGLLFPESTLRSEWTETERPGGTIIEFAAEGSANLKYWFGHQRPEVLERLYVFAKTGAEGSMAAFWLDPEGHQKIVHLGSGSGSIMVCVLADDPVDFLRLLAIGYDEICWGDDYGEVPSVAEFKVHPNLRFRDWVRTSFRVAIPETGLEIVKHPSRMGDAASQDAFNRWVAQNVA